ncbi:MAG: WD40 repeat domain-containing serine/threonine protein kinase [Isosphaeraceae bacterium]|nr:WD40 repeat domain-containing serine/threonine protein kinase [Isosphaeraceae bacterium]
MPRLDCPSPAELSAFNLGALPDESVDEVAEHLEVCARCEAAVEALDRVTDPVVSSLKGLTFIHGRSAPTASPVPLPSRVGDYEILGELGRGGMGIVYKAWHAKLRRAVALKVLLGGEYAHEDYRARFRAEAEAVARLQHPNIVQVFDIGEWHASSLSPPVPYFTLEYVDGGSLSSRLAEKTQPPAQAAQWLATLARAVHYAHGQGIVHRDLKPSNVLLTSDGLLKLCDFGVAKQVSGSDLQTLGGLLMGTPEYMAPEQADGQGRHAGPPADVYALGAILYTMLTGRPLFQSTAVIETLDQVRNQEPVPPRRLRPSVPRDLETICLKCLRKDPRRRYPSAAALAEDLDRFLSGQTILARPAGAVERGWKWARRRPAVALLSTAVVLVTVLGFALVLWQWRRAEGKALAAAASQRESVQEQAELALNQGLSLCDRGEVGHGLLWLGRSLKLATDARASSLDRAIRINLADWAQQLSRPLAEMQHAAPILDLAFSPDGRALVSVGKNHQIRFWDAVAGKEAGAPLVVDDLPARAWVERVAINPHDPREMVTVDEEGHVHFWDLERRRERGAPLVHPSGHVIWGVAFSPDGRRLVTSCDDGASRWWDVSTRERIGSPLRHSAAVGYYTLALSPDGRMLVTGGKDQRAVRWDVATGQPIEPPLLHNSPVSTIAFCRGGQRIITGTRDGRVHVWDAATALSSDLPPQGTSVTSLAVSPDGRTFATGTAGGVVRLWDATMLGQTGQTYILGSAVTGLAFRPDGRTLATGQDDGTIRLWDVPHSKAIGPPLRMGSSLHRVAFSDDGTRLLTGSARGAQWWGLADGRPTGPFMHSSRYEPAGAVSSGDGRRTYDVVDMVEGTALSPDGRTLAVARWSGDEGRVRGRAELWDAAAGTRVRQTPEQPIPLLGVVFSPDTRALLTWDSRPRSALLWDPANLETARPLLRSLDVPIHQAAFSPDGKTLLLACPDARALLWDVDDDRPIAIRAHPHPSFPVTAAAFSPRGTRVVTGTQDGTVRLWDTASGSLLCEVDGNAGEVAAVAFSPDGNMLLTASHNGTARFWDVESGRQLGPPLRHTDAVLCVAFAPDGQSVATGTKDGLAQRWHVPARPEPGNVEDVLRRVESQTGLQLDHQGATATTEQSTPASLANFKATRVRRPAHRPPG